MASPGSCQKGNFTRATASEQRPGKRRIQQTRDLRGRKLRGHPGGGCIAPGPAASLSCGSCVAVEALAIAPSPPYLHGCWEMSFFLPQALSQIDCPRGNLLPNNPALLTAWRGKQLFLGRVCTPPHTCTLPHTHAQPAPNQISPASKDPTCNCQKGAGQQGHAFLATWPCFLRPGLPWFPWSPCQS